MKKLFIIVLIPLVLIGCMSNNEKATIEKQIEANAQKAASDNATRIRIQEEKTRFEKYALNARILADKELAEISSKVQVMLAEIDSKAMLVFWEKSGKPMVILFILSVVAGVILFYGIRAAQHISEVFADMQVKQCKIMEERLEQQHALEQRAAVKKQKYLFDKFIEHKDSFSNEQQEKFLSAFLGNNATSQRKLGGTV